VLSEGGRHLTPRELTTILAHRELKGSHAVDVLKHAIQHGCAVNSFHFNTVITALGRRGQWRDAMIVFDEMQMAEVEPDIDTLLQLVTAVGEGEQAHKKVAKRMQAQRLEPTVVTYTSLISACGVAGEWERAESLFVRMRSKGLRPTVVTYNALLMALEKGGQWERAIEVLTEMREESNIEPDIIGYNTCISACKKVGRWDRALALVHQLRAHGLRANVVTYSALISALAEGEQAERAVRVYEEMARVDVPPNIITFNALLNALARAGKWQRAFGLMAELRAADLKPDLITFTSLISACGRAGKYERALATFRELKGAGLEPDLAVHNVLFDALWAGRLRAESSAILDEATRADAAVYSSPSKPGKLSLRLDLRRASAGGAQALVLRWLEEWRARPAKSVTRPAVVVTGGKAVRTAVGSLLERRLAAPFDVRGGGLSARERDFAAFVASLEDGQLETAFGWSDGAGGATWVETADGGSAQSLPSAATKRKSAWRAYR